jgi:alkanesulfonate monooxygenase SsuD/methylene tetrahydromethanopterin reductase-like flavin-dependent oxidoreductase (luciferase family)
MPPTAGPARARRAPMMFGFHMPNFTFPGAPADGLWDRVVENALAAERACFDFVTVMDHFYQIGVVGTPRAWDRCPRRPRL